MHCYKVRYISERSWYFYWGYYVASFPAMAISIVLEVPMTVRAVEIGILGLGRDWCRHKLCHPISIELTKWLKYKICYVTTIAVKQNIICFYCPLSCLKWIDTIYELKIYAVWSSVNKSIPKIFIMNRALRHYSLTIILIHKSASFI